MTNTDYDSPEYIRGYYLNTATPALNMSYYIQCGAELLKEYESIKSDKKVLIVNTCGWVEGIGADI